MQKLISTTTDDDNDKYQHQLHIVEIGMMREKKNEMCKLEQMRKLLTERISENM